MHRFMIPILAALISIGPARAEETPAVAPVPPRQAPQSPRPADQAESTAQQLEDVVRTELAHAGLTDIQLLPMSILVRAKDAEGNIVTFLVSPRAVADAQEAPEAASPDAGATHPVPGEQKF